MRNRKKQGLFLQSALFRVDGQILDFCNYTFLKSWTLKQSFSLTFHT